jgi:hypothetical protein
MAAAFSAQGFHITLEAAPTFSMTTRRRNGLLAAAILPLQNMDFALEELQRVARIPSVRAVFIRPMFLEDRYLNHPYPHTVRYLGIEVDDALGISEQVEL